MQTYTSQAQGENNRQHLGMQKQKIVWNYFQNLILLVWDVVVFYLAFHLSTEGPQIPN